MAKKKPNPDDDAIIQDRQIDVSVHLKAAGTREDVQRLVVDFIADNADKLGVVIHRVSSGSQFR